MARYRIEELLKQPDMTLQQLVQAIASNSIPKCLKQDLADGEMLPSRFGPSIETQQAMVEATQAQSDAYALTDEEAERQADQLYQQQVAERNTHMQARQAVLDRIQAWAKPLEEWSPKIPLADIRTDLLREFREVARQTRFDYPEPQKFSATEFRKMRIAEAQETVERRFQEYQSEEQAAQKAQELILLLQHELALLSWDQPDPEPQAE